MTAKKRIFLWAAVAAFILTAALSASAQKTTGEPGSPGATTTIDGKQLPPPDPKFGGVIKDDALQSKAVVGAAHRAAQGSAQHPAHHDRRLRLRRAEHLRRRHPDADDGSHREERSALQ